MLSLRFETGDESWGKERSELEAIAANLQSGKAYEYEPAELKRYTETSRAFRAVRPRHLILWFIRFLAPALLVLGVLWSAVYLLRALRK